MDPGLEPAWEAVRILACRNATLHQRLYDAGRPLLPALRQPDPWPKDLLPCVRQIESRLTARGSLEATVNGMDTSVAAEIAAEILELAGALRAASHSRSTPGRAPAPAGLRGRRCRSEAARSAH